MRIRWFIFLGGLLAALAVGLGALGAHALKSQLTAAQLETFHTAVHYQMLHAIGLILLGLLRGNGRNRLFDLAGGAMLLGIVLFSGCLFAWLATGSRLLMFLVPVGGTSFIVGWLALAAGAVVGRERPADSAGK
jgi:uncharacterized membrane protein YgdD (TMEM256/DUF423 family)